jgi:hypothetical protein
MPRVGPQNPVVLQIDGFAAPPELATSRQVVFEVERVILA